MEDAAEKSQPLADYLSEKRKTNSRRLKDMVKKGQLENIELQKGEVKELKKQLNRYGVRFSVMKNKEAGLYSVFFQAKDTKAMDLAFKKAIERYEKKENKRNSTRDILNKLIDALRKLHSLESAQPVNKQDVIDNYLTKTFDRLSKVAHLVPFADKEFIKINGCYYKNIFFNKQELAELVYKYMPTW